MKRSLQTAFTSWIVLTVLVILSLLVIYLRNGVAGLNVYIQQWPLSNLAVTLASTTLTWLLLGALLYLLVNEKINAGNAWLTTGFFLIMFAYLVFLRERFRYGDYHYYIEAAEALLNNQTLPSTYLYLPLWATLLQFIVSLGDQGVFTVLWALNVIALGAFYFLLVRVLERYGFSHKLAILITVAFLLVNTPILRTLVYVQVNLFVMDFILLSLLNYPKNPFLSALALALAVHLKTSPAAIVLAFLLDRNWRWLVWFAFSFTVITIIPAAINGVSPYFDYLNNTFALTQLPNTNFHDTSFDSFLRFLNPFFGIQLAQTRVIVLIVKLLFLIATLLVMMRNINTQSFTKENRMLNAIPALCIFMNLGSPIVWDYHAIFVTLSFLLLLKRVDSPSAWMWFGFAYFLEFIQPSFDFFPWSYGRLLAPIIALALMGSIPQTSEPSRFFVNTVNRLEKMA
jgi:hypothetical protein